MSCESVNFLDVVVSNQSGRLETSLHTKPTDAHSSQPCDEKLYRDCLSEFAEFVLRKGIIFNMLKHW